MSALVKLCSDFVCPFCFIAEQSSLVRLQRELDIVVDWRGFELHPETPLGGMPVTSLVPRARLERMGAYMPQLAARFGIDNMATPEHLPNTRRALAMAEFARDHGRLDAFRDAVMEAHWTRSGNLEQDLRTVASRAGLNPTDALQAADAAPYLERVDALRAEAHGAGVTGIPTFFFGDEKVVGCPPDEELAAGQTPSAVGAMTGEPNDAPDFQGGLGRSDSAGSDSFTLPGVRGSPWRSKTCCPVPGPSSSSIAAAVSAVQPAACRAFVALRGVPKSKLQGGSHDVEKGTAVIVSGGCRLSRQSFGWLQERKERRRRGRSRLWRLSDLDSSMPVERPRIQRECSESGQRPNPVWQPVLGLPRRGRRGRPGTGAEWIRFALHFPERGRKDSLHHALGEFRRMRSRLRPGHRQIHSGDILTWRGNAEQDARKEE